MKIDEAVCKQMLQYFILIKRYNHSGYLTEVRCDGTFLGRKRRPGDTAVIEPARVSYREKDDEN